MLKFFAIALGGALGSLARYGVGTTVMNRLTGTRFWYGTFVINMTACVIIGFSLTYLGRREEISPLWRYFIPIGFVGAYSTFSTFEWELFNGLQSSSYLLSALYTAMSIFIGLLAVWAGVLLAKQVS